MSPSMWFHGFGLGALLCVLGFLLGACPAEEKAGKDQNAFTNSIGMKFVRIPATGKDGFWMGSDEDDRDAPKDEKPRHRVVLTKDFFLGVSEVTQGQYRQVMKYNPSYFSHDGKKADTDGKYRSEPGGGKDRVKAFTHKEQDDFPAELVSWEDAMAFLNKLNARAAEAKFKVTYRLPREAEWEYACRAGSDVKEPYTFKKPSRSISSDLANFNGKQPFGGGNEGRYLERTATVGSFGDKSKNPFGLNDMHGNVYEWCSDWYAADTYTKETRHDPTGPEKGAFRVIRGGNWGSDGKSCRSASRGGNSPEERDFIVGFRVVAVPSE